MALEEAVSKGLCVVTLAQQQSWSRILPLSDILTYFLLGEITDASLCLGRGLAGHTLDVLATGFPAIQSDVEPPRVSRQAVYSALHHSLSNPLALSGWVTLWH